VTSAFSFPFFFFGGEGINKHKGNCHQC
jgi:hypothetical protein